MKKFDVKAGVSFGIGMTVFFILQNFWRSDSSTSMSLGKSLIGGVISGAVAGFLFGLIIGWFRSSKFVSTTTKIKTQPGESILFETPANHIKGIEGVGGKLYLTNQRLVFKSHKLNIQNHELSINLTDITNVERQKTLGINGNMLRVISNNKANKFVIEQADEWISKLKVRNQQ